MNEEQQERRRRLRAIDVRIGAIDIGYHTSDDLETDFLLGYIGELEEAIGKAWRHEDDETATVRCAVCGRETDFDHPVPHDPDCLVNGLPERPGIL